jgi:hypothetical protein
VARKGDKMNWLIIGALGVGAYFLFFRSTPASGPGVNWQSCMNQLNLVLAPIATNAGASMVVSSSDGIGFTVTTTYISDAGLSPQIATFTSWAAMIDAAVSALASSAETTAALNLMRNCKQ